MRRVAYFAYGSNMDSATLSGRRGVEWSKAVPALARGWRLVIDKPSLLGNGEAMATLIADARESTWGVLFDISADDFDHLAMTEGVLIEHYARTEILVVPTADAASTPAVTFTSDTRDTSLKPTVRYMNLLLCGAAEHGLPEAWIDFLRAFETSDEFPESASLAAARDSAMQKPRN